MKMFIKCCAQNNIVKKGKDTTRQGQESLICLLTGPFRL